MNLGILGINGRMGKTVFDLASKDPRINNITEIKRQICFQNIDVIIDFSTPEGTEACLRHALTYSGSIAFVIGTTGLTPEHHDLIKDVSAVHQVIYSPNMSPLMGQLRHLLSHIDVTDNMDIDIVESHHKHKKDAPSGTALWLEDVFEGHDVNISSLRRGHVFGSHTVYLTTQDEEITFSHTAFSRLPFAQGAIDRACRIRNPEQL